MERQVPAELQALVRKTYKALMALSGGTHRHGQRAMIGAIATAVANAKKGDEPGCGARLLAVNAPTGSGKTYGYGVGAIPVALANGLKVVLSTAKVALQEQLTARDLVELQKVVPEMRVAVVKGRGRYFCPVRAAEVAERSDSEGQSARSLLDQLNAGTWSGDVDDLAEAPGSDLWSKCTNDRAGCAGRKCSAYNRCPYYSCRRNIEQANVLVTNHDMLLADVRAGHVILPRPSDCVIVLDEAHTFPAKAVASLADGHTLQDAQQFVMRSGSLIAAIRKADPFGPCGRLAEAAMQALQVMGGSLSEAQVAVESLGQTTEVRDSKRPVRFKGGKLPQWLAKAASDCRATAAEAAACIAELMESLQGEDGDALPPHQRERLLSEVGQAAGRIERIVAVWSLMTADAGGDGPVAKWIEVSEASRDLRVCASPIGVAQYLHDALWSKVAATIHLSGTLATVGGMDPYLQASGLSITEGVRTLAVDTPFDYATQASLIVPRNVSNPKDAAAHTQWLIDHIPRMLKGIGHAEGALVLFTSFAQLRQVADAMPSWVQEVLLAQDRFTKREVVARHTAAIQAGRRSVIFGTSTYEEGVDLPGKLCSLVVVAKLQFAVPNDPVSEELRDHLEAKGLSHFNEVAVPEACRRLAQSTGRLIRTEQDRGSVVIADPRLTGTQYGRKMLAALPPYRFSRELLAA